jgi:hypothetical protein
MFKAPSPFNSMFTSWESPLPMLVYGTSSQHPNKAHKYVNACHLGSTSKFLSSCQQTPISLLKLEFQLNPPASLLTLPTLWTMSKSYSCKIMAHFVNFPMKWFYSMNVNGLHKDNTKMMYHPNNNKAYPLIRTILDLCLVVGPISICHPCNVIHELGW